MLDISSLGFARDVEAAEWFVREVGVAGVPGSSFFREPENRFIRFHFAKKRGDAARRRRTAFEIS